MPLVASAQNSGGQDGFMMAILVYFVDNFAKCTYCVMNCGEAFGYRDGLPLESFE
jgi:hypothetical protein